MARAGDDLPLVDQVDVAAQRLVAQVYCGTPMPACGAGLVPMRTLMPGARLAWLR
jgi:hypothetical protein